MAPTMEAAAVAVPNDAAIMEKANAKTWDGLSRMAFAANWDPENDIDWDRPIELGKIKEGWINILHYFYEGEWQGLEIIQRLMNKAAHMFKINEMVTYYSTHFHETKTFGPARFTIRYHFRVFHLTTRGKELL